MLLITSRMQMISSEILMFLDKLIKDRGGDARGLNATPNSSPNFVTSLIPIKGR